MQLTDREMTQRLEHLLLVNGSPNVLKVACRIIGRLAAQSTDPDVAKTIAHNINRGKADATGRG